MTTTAELSDLEHGLTFRENRSRPIHDWYPYVEGFSSNYVREILEKHATSDSHVYDPFGGAGTVQLVCSSAGISSSYSEINPFMHFVSDAKVNQTISAQQEWDAARSVMLEFVKLLRRGDARRWKTSDLASYYQAFPNRGFFEVQDIGELIAALSLASDLTTDLPAVNALLKLACASNAVHCSNMTRRADLRRRRPDEYKSRVVDVSDSLAKTVEKMIRDLDAAPRRESGSSFVSADCRELPETAVSPDLAITSPPYLNGTNYFRNTKIELWLTGFIQTEAELSGYTRKALRAGINNVQRSVPVNHSFSDVESFASRLDVASPDARIPALIRAYFSDMYDVFAKVWRHLKPGGLFVLDIGDSKFYDIHVPTDKILSDLAGDVGFRVENRLLARRYSRDRTPLLQAELTMRKAL